MTEYFEDEHTELKCELIDGIKSEIIAFLNSDGGIIYVGVEDEEILNKVFSIFKEKYKDEFNFVDED